MKLGPAIAAALALSIFICPITSHCQTDNPIGDLSGASVPSITTLGDIAAAPGHWYTFDLIDTSGLGGYGNIFATIFGGAGSSGFYTSGRIVKIGDTPFLVAYRAQAKPPDYTALMHGAWPRASAPDLTADTAVTPALLNMSTLPGMVDIRPFDLQTVTADSGKQSNILAAILSSEHAAARPVSGKSQAQQIMFAVLEYIQSHKGHFPPMTNVAVFESAIATYTKSTAVFTDPATGKPFEPNHSLSGKPLSAVADPEKMVVIYSEPQTGGSRIVGFADGDAKSLDPSQWVAAKADSHIR